MLDYARKNKYPWLRSAFTYIDEEQPHSRLDFGKHKFGPFTEEEVENVKTVLHLIPLLVAVVGSALVFNERYDQFNLHAIKSTSPIRGCFDKMQNNVGYIAGFILIPVYHFAIYSFIKKYIPSMLKIMGAEIFLCLITTCSQIGCQFSWTFLQQCISLCLWWQNYYRYYFYINILGIDSWICEWSQIEILCSLYEFVMAQTPNKMRGIMMGLVLIPFPAPRPTPPLPPALQSISPPSAPQPNPLSPSPAPQPTSPPFTYSVHSPSSNPSVHSSSTSAAPLPTPFPPPASQAAPLPPQTTPPPSVPWPSPPPPPAIQLTPPPQLLSPLLFLLLQLLSPLLLFLIQLLN